MAFYRHNGRTLCYRLLGEAAKPLLVLAHPLGMNQLVWDEMLPALLATFRVLTWDLPGHGDSADWPEAVDRITPEDLAGEALALADLAGAETFAFAGTSIGGVIGQQLLTNHAGRLTGAVLTNTGAVIGTPDSWAARAADVLQKGLARMAPGIVTRWFGPATVAQQPALVEGWAIAAGRGDDRSYALLCQMLADTDFRERLGQRRTPLTLVAGADDLATPPESLATLAECAGAGAPIILERIGHVPSVECPAVLSEILLSHLS
ncbi:alpha/beta fold hydrolase [Marinobacter sp. C2H3]|uniref:alpha/beta fold hydrolase n=1 Tax=Marinobacter sp. C2H3 TaxID=3119003 RepID=UPI00300EE9F6